MSSRRAALNRIVVHLGGSAQPTSTAALDAFATLVEADALHGLPGTAGAPGSVWRDGSGAPSNGLGVDGDYYLDHTIGNAYRKSAGAYAIVASLIGPAGLPGVDGVDGVNGADGIDGVDGTPGSTGPAGPAPAGTGFVHVTSGALDTPVAFGTTAGTVAQGSDTRFTDARTPTAHKTSHQDGGSDEINVAGLSGLLADAQHPIIGSGATDAVAGNDSRMTNARTPTAHTHPESDIVNLVTDLAAKQSTSAKGQPNGYASLDALGQVPTAQIPGVPVLAHHASHQDGGTDEINVQGLSGVLADPQPPIIGSTGATAVAGNDTRLTNARTPTSHASTHQPGGGDAMAVDAVAATGSLRTLGTGAQQAAAGTDSRFTDARTPTAHAASHTTGSDKLATGTPDGTKFLRDDYTWQTPTAATPEVLQTNNAPAGDVTVAAGYSVFSDEEFVIADGKELVLSDGASLVVQ